MRLIAISRIISNCLLKSANNARSNVQICAISTTNSHSSYNKFWREKRGMTRCGNEDGPLTDLPDWSYLDGRPAPLGIRQMARYSKQIELTKKVVNLLNEVDFAVTRHKKIEEERENDLRIKLETKLKPKGGFVKKSKK